jgi:hypothetical protein
MKRRALLGSLVGAAGLSAFGRLYAAEPKAPARLSTDRPPLGFGVYLGAGCSGAERLGEYQRWLRRDVDQTLEFISWQVLEAGRAWAVNCWDKSGQKNVVYSLPMLPTGRSAKLADGASGKFDALFSQYGGFLVKHGYGRSTIRIGWEFNAEWYPWAASHDPKSWTAYWRRIVDTLRKTPDSDFKFDWSVAGSARGFDAGKAYPGDDYVDVIGLDFYNTKIDEQRNTTETRWESRKTMQHGLQWHRDFARSHGKPMSLPEWGTGVHVKWGGPPDDPYFIENMAAWIRENDIAYHNYWEYRNKDYDSRLSDDRQPQAAAAFLKAFGGKRSKPAGA